jgi:hypothetical protein
MLPESLALQCGRNRRETLVLDGVRATADIPRGPVREWAIIGLRMNQCFNGRSAPAVGQAIEMSSLAGASGSRHRTKAGDAPKTFVGLVRLASS